MHTYEITWISGKVEIIEAESMKEPSHLDHQCGHRSSGQQHFQFFRSMNCVLSVRESDVISVRLVENPLPLPHYSISYSRCNKLVSANLCRDGKVIVPGRWTDLDESALSYLLSEIVK